tara:strand:+ start:1652 stop:2239 length:588 start_codon:yes stop_codon:yes gene_type:complete
MGKHTASARLATLKKKKNLWGGGDTHKGLWGLGVNTKTMKEAKTKVSDENASKVFMRRLKNASPDTPIINLMNPNSSGVEAKTSGFVDSSKKISTDPNVHNAPEGWFPTSLSRKDKKLYVKYVNEYGQPGNRWVDGTPRNPMPEIREQDIFDSTVGSWNNPATPEANEAIASVREQKNKINNMKVGVTKMGFFGN